MLVRKKDLKKEKVVFQVSPATKKKWEAIQKMAEQEDLEIDQDELLMKSFLLLEKRLEKLIPEIFDPAPSSPGDPGNHKGMRGSESGSWTSERRTGDERTTKGGTHQEN